MKRETKNIQAVRPLGVMGYVYAGLLMAIFGGIVFHAPISVGFSTLFPDQSFLIKSWKEMLMGAALVLMVVLLTTYKQWGIFKSRLIGYIACFAAVHLVLIGISDTGTQAILAGLLIDLRYLLFFVLMYAAIKLYPQLLKPFITVFFIGAGIITVFATLQATVLPNDILKHIGYGSETIAPYLTVDENDAYVRVNSTLRGPNPLGAFAVISLVMALVLWFRGPRTLKSWQLWAVIGLGATSVVALWASYSRSAALAALVALAVATIVIYGKKMSRMAWTILAVVAIVISGSVVALRETDFVSHVILHEDPSEGNNVNSNDGHAESLVDGTKRMLAQPLGGGIGSTGSASLLSPAPLIIENQYLFIAHEAGWIGLAIFILIFCYILAELWRRRRYWFALGAFASGLGLAVIGMLLPVWVDDTVSIIWWGIAGMVVALPIDFGTSAKKKKS